MTDFQSVDRTSKQRTGNSLYRLGSNLIFIADKPLASGIRFNDVNLFTALGESSLFQIHPSESVPVPVLFVEFRQGLPDIASRCPHRADEDGFKMRRVSETSVTTRAVCLRNPKVFTGQVHLCCSQRAMVQPGHRSFARRAECRLSTVPADRNPSFGFRDGGFILNPMVQPSRAVGMPVGVEADEPPQRTHQVITAGLQQTRRTSRRSGDGSS